MKLTIGYFYPELLNLYGDNGNVEILAHRARARGIEVEVLRITEKMPLTTELMNSINFLFMGGGPDAAQESMYADLIGQKAPYLREYVARGGAGLLICGSYQLFGKYYKAADGVVLEGLHIFDLYTEHFGKEKPRCIGNVVARLNDHILSDPVFQSLNHGRNTIVGFENHGGRTYLGAAMTPFATVESGYGNNAEDSTEGATVQNMIGTYFHGPLLATNPHLADYFIAKAVGVDTLKEIDDALIWQAHDKRVKMI